MRFISPQMINKERRGSSERIPAVENGLMRLEQVRYYLAWHRLLGDQRRVLDNAMGPNISSDLFLTNAAEIVAIDAKGFYNAHSHQYVEDYWDLVDNKPIYRAGAFGYGEGVTAEGLQLPDEGWGLFHDHCEDRRRRGYWDFGAINHWDIDRLLFLELKKMGVERESIEIEKPSTGVTMVRFDWAYPGEETRPRKLTHLTGTLDWLMKTKTGKLISSIDFYLQKGLETDLTPGYIRRVTSRMCPVAVFAIGYIFGASEENQAFKGKLGEVLGDRFLPLAGEEGPEKMIDDLPDGDGRGEIKRGIKLHVFRRGGAESGLG